MHLFPGASNVPLDTLAAARCRSVGYSASHLPVGAGGSPSGTLVAARHAVAAERRAMAAAISVDALLGQG